MQYIFSYQNPHTHLIDIEFIAPSVTGDETTIQLPAWRPGRYELGNFAKNIKQFIATDEKGNTLDVRKASKDCWKINTKEVKKLTLYYSYYAAELNAGSTYLDEKQLYVNPVNCCIYIPEKINEACEIEIKIPADYNIATSLKTAAAAAHRFHANDFHALADSPFIASKGLKHHSFEVEEVAFHLWFQGECKPNWTKLEKDFTAFIKEQFSSMKNVTPAPQYHFLFHALPYRFHHGVEHSESTVIALGPSYDLMHGDTYLELLSISSHELYHAWNIKSIRPAEMFPYDYTQENYSRLGYVCEGVTTYYGDFFLYRSGVYSFEEYATTLAYRLSNHFDNFGRYNLSVADSSFDTWLDGYTEIVPHRKTSIYTEGCLLALMTDLLLRRYTQNNRSLDDVMQTLYNDFYKKGKGYTEADYQKICEALAGNSFATFFKNYVHSPSSFENPLAECLDYVGLQLNSSKSKKHHERFYGIKTISTILSTKIIAVYPGSIAEAAGLQVGDELIAINGYPIKNNLHEWAAYLGHTKIKLTVLNAGKLHARKLYPSEEEYYKNWFVEKKQHANASQKDNYNCWSKNEF
jgi:predicted metalloprotease with PDZ domain